MSDRILVSLIAAVAANGVIGNGSEIPWRLSTDMRRFRRLTLGKPVIMGRKTFESLPGPLSGRPNIVVGSQVGPVPAGVSVCTSIDSALETAYATAAATGENEVMVLGGGEIYAATIEGADRLYITHVDLEPSGDVVFPVIDAQAWRAVKEEVVPAGERDETSSRFVVYERRAAAGGG